MSANNLLYERSQQGQGLTRLTPEMFTQLRDYLTHAFPEESGTGTCVCEAPPELCAYLARASVPFSRCLMEFIGKKGLDEVEVYKRAHVDRKLFSKMRSDASYHPKKTTVIAFALALQLSLEETRELLSSAGFTLSRCTPFDLIIHYFLERNIYDLIKINDALFDFNQPLLML
jgi:O-acetyl-ADP-ribose deacetylase